jgi:hypothetical protein
MQNRPLFSSLTFALFTLVWTSYLYYSKPRYLTAFLVNLAPPPWPSSWRPSHASTCAGRMPSSRRALLWAGADRLWHSRLLGFGICSETKWVLWFIGDHLAQGKGGRYTVVQIEDECKRLSQVLLNRIKKKSRLFRQILATVINASVYTIPQHPPTQTIDVTHRHSGTPSSIRPLTIPNLPSGATRRLTNLSSHLCHNCRGGGLSHIPGYCRGGRRMLNTSHLLSCQFCLWAFANAPPSL